MLLIVPSLQSMNNISNMPQSVRYFGKLSTLHPVTTLDIIPSHIFLFWPLKPRHSPLAEAAWHEPSLYENQLLVTH